MDCKSTQRPGPVFIAEPYCIGTDPLGSINGHNPVWQGMTVLHTPGGPLPSVVTPFTPGRNHAFVITGGR